ncbi:MAG: response regulator [Candidatus Scalindua sp. AMX11]|nr:MAG: response regulator [Candidatus Scalindua sp.]NOG85671.1 response regulator [Planctomycetota bacterium]RZV82436.1 MAG: response regulator [Candidatus Scalindua sp. SCAELEC01]TDE65642.1 MAG: response regulator [Candidatus Scalindua sp. AMX11]GJQ59160.1 MAG: hypothetical protein SCALA701_19610 [Candidatus Scalindua sp.]
MEHGRIIIVEREQDTSDDIKLSLLNMGYVVPAVVTLGVSVLQTIENHRPNLVILDRDLHDKEGGVDLAYQIRNQFNIPILFLTTQVEDTVLQMVDNIHSFRYLLKPVKEEELRVSLKTLLPKHTIGIMPTETDARLLVTDSYLQLLQIIPSTVHENGAITTAFQQVLDEICQSLGWQIGQTFFVTKDTPTMLRVGKVRKLEDEKRFKKFCSVTKKIDFPMCIGLPGRVLESGKPHLIVDVTKDNNFIRVNIAKELHLKSALAFPVKVGSQVVAVLEFFSTKEKKPDSQLMKVVTALGIQLGLIVERKEKQGEIEKFKFFSDNSNEIHILFDRELRVLYVNKVACEKFGYSENEFLELTVPDIDDIFESTKYREVFRAIEENQVHPFETRNRRKDETNFPCKVTLKRIILDGKPHAIAIFKDLTGEKQLEEALLRSEKIKTLGVITSGVAHTFNNILTIVSSNAQLLEEKYRYDKALRKPLHTICRVVDEGAAIVDRMYEFVNVNGASSGRTSVDMGALLKETIDYTKPRWKEIAQARGITYHIDSLGIKKTAAIWGNIAEVREVLVNIINNSLDAMPDGGTLSFRTWDDNGSVCTSISDTGVGMSKKFTEMIYDSFFTTKRLEGTGLGMSISHSLISKHGGTIDVESERGKGCTVVIRLPVTEKVYPSGSSPFLTDKIKAENIHILVIDDEEDICESLSDYFTQNGITVKSVSSGKEAVKLIQNEVFDLLICDLVMPDINGKEVIRMLDTVPVDKRPMVGIMTGWKYGLEDAKREGLKVDFIINKPFNLSKLRRDFTALLGAGS